MRRLLQSLIVGLTLAGIVPAYAATITELVETVDTTSTPKTTASYTPTSGRLQLILMQVSATVQATATCTNTTGLPFTQIVRAEQGAAANSIYAFVADAATSNTASQTVTCDTASDPGTGGGIIVLETDVTRVGLDAIEQSVARSNVVTGTDNIPDVTFASAVQTGNPTIAFMMNVTNPSGMTEPTGWTEGADTGYASPTMGVHYAHRASGFTGTNIVWGSTTASAWGAIGLEIDASVAASPPAWTAVPTITSQTDTSQTAGFTPDAASTIYGVSVPINSAAPSVAQIKAGQNGTGGAALAANSKAVTGVDTLVLTLAGTPRPPLTDTYYVLNNAGGDSSVQTIQDWFLNLPAGENRVTLTSIAVGSFAEDIGAPLVATDIIQWTIATDPGLYTTTINAAGQVSYDSGGDQARQTGLARAFDVSAGAYLNGGDQYQWVINNLAPEPEVAPIFGEVLFYEVGVAITDINLLPLAPDPEGDTVVVSALNALPTGLSITASGNYPLTGTPTVCGVTLDRQIQWLDQFGDAYIESTIDFTIGARVPNVVDVAEATAITNIEALCTLDAVKGSSVHHQTIAVGNVVSVSPAVSTLVGPIQVVTYSLSLGPSQGPPHPGEGQLERLRRRGGMRIVL